MSHASPELLDEFREAVMSGRHGPILYLVAQLKDCSDAMPSDVCAALEMEPGSTYADAVRENWPGV
jgi:hypothetical protein